MIPHRSILMLTYALLAMPQGTRWMSYRGVRLAMGMRTLNGAKQLVRRSCELGYVRIFHMPSHRRLALVAPTLQARELVSRIFSTPQRSLPLGFTQTHH